MEWLFLGCFCALLLASMVLKFHILYALLGGYLLFFLYGLLQKHSPAALLKMSAQGIRTVRNILFLFLLIGMTTSLWRGSGTLPYLICRSAEFISPTVFPLLSFLLCSGMSFLTGTSFGTAATVGAICMAMANTMGLSPTLSGGAILAGSFFGDRCSPMSTSALLVSALTETDLYRNLKRMMTSAAVPLAITCLIYLAAGFAVGDGAFSQDVLAPFSQGFSLHWITVLPAVVIVLLSLFKCKVKLTMGLSIFVSGVLCVPLQGMSPGDLVQTALTGYTSSLPALNALLAGGGLVSMVPPFCIVWISSSFSGLFEGTGLLDGMKASTYRLGERVTAFGSLLAVSILTCLIACNQTLAIMLSHTLCKDSQNSQDLAIGLENTAVVIAPLIPWSIAGAVPLASLNAPTSAILAACYLYLIPLWNLAVHFSRKSKPPVEPVA